MLRLKRVTKSIGRIHEKIQIEGRVLGDIARNHVVPTAIKYQNVLIENVKGLKKFLEKISKKL